MFTLTPLPQSRTGDLRYDAGISDLVVIDGPGGPVLMAVAGGREGGITTFDLSADRAPRVEQTTAAGISRASATGPDLVATDDGRVLVAGLDSDAIRLGMPGGTLSKRAAGSGDWTLAASTGTTLALAEDDGASVAVFALTGSGGLSRIGTASGGRQGSTSDIGALAMTTIGEQDILLTASATGHSVGAWLVGSGGVRAAGITGPAQGIGIMTPTDMVVTEVAGRHMVLVASAPSAGQSGALTVLSLDARGTLVPLDHVTDSLGSRFGQVQSIAVAEHDGRTLVAAGGGDDGISLFTLTADGQLIHLTAFADTEATRLTGVTALALSVQGDTLQLHAASGEGMGITTLTADLTRLGRVQQAADEGEHLRAGPAGDILIGGAGTDRLTGGAGGDLFVVTPDGARNRIDQFDPAQDRIDLGTWPLLYDTATLDIRKSGAGVVIEGRGKRLEVTGTSGAALDPDAVRAAILLSASRSFAVPETVATGGAGHDRLEGSWGLDTLTGGAGNDTLAGGLGDDMIFGGAGHDVVEIDADFADTVVYGTEDGQVTISSSQGIDIIADAESFVFRDGTFDFATITAPRPINGTEAADHMTGTPGSDRLSLGGGDDTVAAGLGDDDIRGQGGRDDIWGNGGDDLLDGGAGADTLRGGPGMDRIDGGAGKDVIRGQKHADILYGGQGDDNIKGGGGNDTLSGGAGHDFLKGGTRSDVIYGGDEDDLLSGNRHDDTLRGGDGDDRLRAGDGDDELAGGGGNDILKGGTGADTFIFAAGDGADTIVDFDPAEDLLRLSISPLSMAHSAGDLVVFFTDGGSLRLIGLTDPDALAAATEII